MSEVNLSTWRKVANLYEELGTQFDPMLQFVRRIEDSEFADVLFPYTSMFTLCIGHTRSHRMNCEELRIDFDSKKGIFHFKYVPNPYSPTGVWETTATPSEAFTKLDRFLTRYIRWFSRPSESGT